jgi:hypothetical protein
METRAEPVGALAVRAADPRERNDVNVWSAGVQLHAGCCQYLKCHSTGQPGHVILYISTAWKRDIRHLLTSLQYMYTFASLIRIQ